MKLLLRGDALGSHRLLGPGRSGGALAVGEWSIGEVEAPCPLFAGMSAAEAAMYALTQGGYICWTNAAFDRLYGTMPGELVGKHQAVLNVSSVEVNLALLDEIRAGITHRGWWTGRTENRRRDGSLFAGSVQVFPWDNGDACRLIVVQKEVRSRQ